MDMSSMTSTDPTQFGGGAGMTPDSSTDQLSDAFGMGQEQMMKVKMMTLLHDMIMEALRAIKF